MPSTNVVAAISSWEPKSASPVVAAFTRETVAACDPASPARARALIHALAKLASFADSVGIQLDPARVLHLSVIERFLATAGMQLGPATRRTVATNLRAMRRRLIEADRPDPLALPRERAKAPYSPGEIDHYLALAAAQPTLSRAMRATALICLGAGAGLTGVDLRHVRGSDVRRLHGGLVVTVAGCHRRRVPVLARFHGPLKPAADYAGEGFIVGGVDRARKNITSGLVASLAGGIDLPPLDMRRLRSTWLTSVAETIGLHAFMDAAGVDCSQRLGDIVSHIAPVEEELAVRLLSGAK